MASKDSIERARELMAKFARDQEGSVERQELARSLGNIAHKGSDDDVLEIVAFAQFLVREHPRSS